METRTFDRQTFDRRHAMQAATEFAGINLALHIIPRNEEELRKRVLSFVSLYGGADDARLQVLVAYLRAILPDWIPDERGRTHNYRRKP